MRSGDSTALSSDEPSSPPVGPPACVDPSSSLSGSPACSAAGGTAAGERLSAASPELSASSSEPPRSSSSLPGSAAPSAALSPMSSASPAGGPACGAEGKDSSAAKAAACMGGGSSGILAALLTTLPAGTGASPSAAPSAYAHSTPAAVSTSSIGAQGNGATSASRGSSMGSPTRVRSIARPVTKSSAPSAISTRANARSSPMRSRHGDGRPSSCPQPHDTRLKCSSYARRSATTATPHALTAAQCVSAPWGSAESRSSSSSPTPPSTSHAYTSLPSTRKATSAAVPSPSTAVTVARTVPAVGHASASTRSAPSSPAIDSSIALSHSRAAHPVPAPLTATLSTWPPTPSATKSPPGAQEAAPTPLRSARV